MQLFLCYNLSLHPEHSNWRQNESCILSYQISFLFPYKLAYKFYFFWWIETFGFGTVAERLERWMRTCFVFCGGGNDVSLTTNKRDILNRGEREENEIAPVVDFVLKSSRVSGLGAIKHRHTQIINGRPRYFHHLQIKTEGNGRFKQCVVFRYINRCTTH